MSEKIRKAIMENLTIVILLSTVLVGGTTFVWGAIAKPAIKKEIYEQQKPLIDRVSEIEELLVYQNIIHMVNTDSTQRDKIDNLFKVWKRGRKK